MSFNINEYYAKYHAQKDQAIKKLREIYSSGTTNNSRSANFSKSENTDPRKAYFTEQTKKLQYEAKKLFDTGEMRYSDSVRAVQAKDPLFACDLIKLELGYKAFNLDNLGIPEIMKTSIINNVMQHNTVKATFAVRRGNGMTDVVLKTVPDEHGKYHYTIIDFAD